MTDQPEACYWCGAVPPCHPSRHRDPDASDREPGAGPDDPPVPEACDHEILLDQGGAWLPCELVAGHLVVHVAYLTAPAASDATRRWRPDVFVTVRWSS